MNDSSPSSQIARPRQPAWNKGKLTGPKPPLRPGHVWSIRAKLQLERRTRDLAVAPNRYAVDRATIRQRKTGRPVRFELTEVTRQALDDYLRESGRTVGQFLFPGRRRDQSLTTRQYARLVSLWISGIGLDRLKYATHSMRRTKATLIYRRTGNLRAVQLLLGHRKLRVRCATWVSRSTTRLRSPKRSMSDVPRQSCRALPTALQGKGVP